MSIVYKGDGTCRTCGCRLLIDVGYGEYRCARCLHTGMKAAPEDRRCDNGR